MGNRGSSSDEEPVPQRSRSASTKNPPKQSVDSVGVEKKRRQSGSSSQSVSGDGKNELNLSEAHILQVRKIWGEARKMGPEQPGKTILISVCKKSPEISRIFSFAPGGQNINPDTASIGMEKSGNTDLDTHSRRFTRAIEEFLGNLGNLDIATAELESLGRRHAVYRKEGFSPKFWDVFAEAMVENSLDWGSRNQRNPKFQEGWNRIVMFIIEKVKKGYYDEKRRNRLKAAGRSYSTVN